MIIEGIGVELSMLTWAAALLLVLVLIQATVGVRAQGLMPLAGTRDVLPPQGVFQARMLRVVDNHREGLTIFAPLAIICYVTQQADAQSALGAQLFLYSRIAHALLYMFGVPLVRPLVWAVGIAGTVMVLLSIVQ